MIDKMINRCTILYLKHENTYLYGVYTVRRRRVFRIFQLRHLNNSYHRKRQTCVAGFVNFDNLPWHEDIFAGALRKWMAKMVNYIIVTLYICATSYIYVNKYTKLLRLTHVSRLPHSLFSEIAKRNKYTTDMFVNNVLMA